MVEIGARRVLDLGPLRIHAEDADGRSPYSIGYPQPTQWRISTVNGRPTDGKRCYCIVPFGIREDDDKRIWKFWFENAFNPLEYLWEGNDPE